jgi:hypothetical protein
MNFSNSNIPCIGDQPIARSIPAQTTQRQIYINAPDKIQTHDPNVRAGKDRLLPQTARPLSSARCYYSYYYFLFFISRILMTEQDGLEVGLWNFTCGFSVLISNVVPAVLVHIFAVHSHYKQRRVTRLLEHNCFPIHLTSIIVPFEVTDFLR